jgi:sulfur relay (sulfurtransferase) complex TusBCD TusD component (DsrE family)
MALSDFGTASQGFCQTVICNQIYLLKTQNLEVRYCKIAKGYRGKTTSKISKRHVEMVFTTNKDLHGFLAIEMELGGSG